ncbi:MAG: Sulfate/thiosulfate import ATP-binding protein CysA [Syntrophorhabdus sp. PtaU1.Bin002]|nr:MAG: Sulfate/thiosulfate import ATP-binding protein CysA [Syntrophorhabdus sp. PtaB.Bin006]OPY72992.1 MAG: Sulfate/thiosulfate import ATP-binding protein CysA [Syntrophorhabdus sp. PtaU1.Bin002]
MISIKGLSARAGSFSIRDISLDIRDSEYFVIVGPTGAGKTILLECLAGLHRLRSGEIHVGERDITSLPPEKRQVGYVPQDYALFPFLNVRDNITFGLRRMRHDKHEVNGTVESLAHLLGIHHLLDRNVRTLSGGEKQRIAIARALAISPKMLLLDEPMGSLDVRTAKFLRLELKRFHEELGITTIHVTHNLIEAEEMAERMAIMNVGKIEQIGTPERVFFYPQSAFVSDFIGTPNILDCDHCNDLGHGLMEAVCGGVPIILPYQGEGVRKIALLPREIYVTARKPPGPGLNRFRGTVTEITPFSSLMKLKISVGELSLVAELPQDIFEEMDIKTGQEVFLILKLRSLKVH